MRLFIPEPKIDIGKDSFEIKSDGTKSIDKLDRKPFGDQLSSLLSAVTDPVVVAIDGGWGTGKSVFLKLWVGEHLNRDDNKDQVVYFDAFQHDYLNDPLIALVSAISAAEESEGKSKLNTLKNAAAALARPAFRIGLAMASSGVSEVTGAVGDAVAKAAAGELAKSAEAFWKKEDGRRAAMEEFQNALTDLAGSNEDGKLIVVVDELDRCRPDYALALLETIKHFFAVDNVHFVLGVNLAELKNMVKARYGLETSAEGYLHKFIHLRMALPVQAGLRPEDTAAAVHFENIVEEMEIPKDLAKGTNDYIKLRTIPPSLREVERLASYVALVAPSLENEVNGDKEVILGAAVLKAFNPSIYAKLLDGTATFPDVAQALFLTDDGTRPVDGHHSAQYSFVAWAGFMDQGVWDAADQNIKESMFGWLSVPFHRDVRLSGILQKYLETFQLPEPPQ